MLERIKYLFSIKKVVLYIALFISLFLSIAAYGKFFAPAEKIKELELLVSVFEVVLIVLLVVFRMHYVMWVIASLVFASWGGYATYWSCLKLPCNCIGTWIVLPSIFALSLDILFFILSCTVIFLLATTRNALYLTLLGAMLFALVGYVFAEWVFVRAILGMKWSLLT